MASDLVVDLRRSRDWLEDFDPMAAEVNRLAADRIEALEAEVMRLQRQRERLDCRYAGQYAEMSGRHCPIGDPCQRCRMERAEAEVKRLREARDRAWADGYLAGANAARAALAGEGNEDD